MPTFLPTKSYPTEYTLTVSSSEEGIEFYSRFENANLAKAFRLSKDEYELHLSEDYNTTGHYHWFYFKTTSQLPSNTTVTFKITNMIKPSSLYSKGFKPFAYPLTENIGWITAGHDISYLPNDSTKKCYTLTWKYTYKHKGDIVYFAQFIPYTYSDLLIYLRSIENESIMRVDMLCKTLGRNVCPMITITEDIGSFISYKSERKISAMSKNTRGHMYNRMEKLQAKVNKHNVLSEIDHSKTYELEMILMKHKKVHGSKKGVVIVARVHPGINS